jgi:hypothetical protein
MEKGIIFHKFQVELKKKGCSFRGDESRYENVQPESQISYP